MGNYVIQKCFNNQRIIRYIFWLLFSLPISSTLASYMMAVPLVTPCKSSPLSILKPKSSEVISSIYSRIQLIQHLQNVVAPNIFHPRIVYDCRALAYPLKSSPLSILVYSTYNISKPLSLPISSTLASYMMAVPLLIR